MKKELNYLKILFFSILLLIIAKFIFEDKISEIVTAFKPFIYASIFIYLFGPIVNLLQNRTRLSRIYALILTYIGFLIFLASFFSLIAPSIIDSVRLLIANVSEANINNLIAYLKELPIISSLIDFSSLAAIITRLEELLIEYSSNIFKYSSTILNSIGSIVITVIMMIFGLLMSFYALRDTENIATKMENIVYAFFKEAHALKIIRIAKLTDTSIKKYLFGKLYTCLIMGILTAFAMTIINIVTPLNIPYIPLISLIIGISNLIPYIGAIFGTTPCILMALLSGFWEAVALLMIVVVIQQIDNIIITPKIIGDTVGLKPFWVIVAISVGGGLFGITGMILAVPFVYVFLFLIEEKVNIYLKNKSGA